MRANSARIEMFDLGSLGLLLGGGEGMGAGLGGGINNDYFSMLLFSKAMSGEDVGDDKRFQMLLYAPMGKKLLARLANKIRQKSRTEGVELAPSVAEMLASDIIRDIEEEQEGDMKQILKMARMSVRMNILGSPIMSNPITMMDTAQENTLAVEGFVKGRLVEEKTAQEELNALIAEKESSPQGTPKSIQKKSWE